MIFMLIGPLFGLETFAVGTAIRDQKRLRRHHGGRHWRKRKGFARIRLIDGSEHLAELHWYEANGVGRREMKVKRIIE